jgi:hypothetical protein
MFKTFLVGLLKTAVSTEEFKTTLAEGVRGAIANSRTAAGITDKVNSLVDVASAKFDGMGLKGRMLKGYLIGLLQDMADDSPQIAAGLKLGTPYIAAVLDGIDPNEVATASLSLIGMLKARAIQAAQEKGL